MGDEGMLVYDWASARVDEDLAETLRSHDAEIAEFEEALYPKPWGDDGIIMWLHLQLMERHERGEWPTALRCTLVLLKEIIREDMGDGRLFSVMEVRHGYHLFGLAVTADDTLPRYKVVFE